MELQNQGNPILAFISAAISFTCGIISWISMLQLQPYISAIAGMLGIVSAVFAIRYYYYATKEKKQSLKTSK